MRLRRIPPPPHPPVHTHSSIAIFWDRLCSFYMLVTRSNLPSVFWRYNLYLFPNVLLVTMTVVVIRTIPKPRCHETCFVEIHALSFSTYYAATYWLHQSLLKVFLQESIGLKNIGCAVKENRETTQEWRVTSYGSPSGMFCIGENERYPISWMMSEAVVSAITNQTK